MEHHVVGEACRAATYPFARDRFWLLLAYAPLEFLALAMAAATSQRLSILIVGNLVYHEPLRPRALLAALTGVVALVALAAVIEAHVGQRFAYGPLAAQGR